MMSYDARTIREAGIGAKVVTTNGHPIEVVSESNDGYFWCKNHRDEDVEIHGSCRLHETLRHPET